MLREKFPIRVTRLPIREVSRRFLSLLVPRTCAACSIQLFHDEDRICLNCLKALSAIVGGEYCRACGRSASEYVLVEGRCTGCMMKKTPLRFYRYFRVGRYEGPLRELILNFKREPTLSDFLGGMLHTSIDARSSAIEIDHWIPIPSPWRRRLRRGFQPTELLAHHVAKSYGKLPSLTLAMAKYVPPFHHHMKEAARRAAINGAFKVRDPAQVKGRVVCLVDDVTTTGATLEEAKRVLREAGAKRVAVAVLARVER